MGREGNLPFPCGSKYKPPPLYRRLQNNSGDSIFPFNIFVFGNDSLVSASRGSPSSPIHPTHHHHRRTIWNWQWLVWLLLIVDCLYMVMVFALIVCVKIITCNGDVVSPLQGCWLSITCGDTTGGIGMVAVPVFSCLSAWQFGIEKLSNPSLIKCWKCS